MPNTDPAYFEDPLTFDITHNTTDMLTFGFGPHYCLGAHPAKSELRCATNAILDVMLSTSAIVESDRTYEPIGIINRTTNMPIDFDAGL